LNQCLSCNLHLATFISFMFVKVLPRISFVLTKSFLRWISSSSAPTALLYPVFSLWVIINAANGRPVWCPARSVLGPMILFQLYTADLIGLVETHGLQSHPPHLYADDTQIIGSRRPCDTAQLLSRLSACIDDVGQWMRRTGCSSTWQRRTSCGVRRLVDPLRDRLDVLWNLVMNTYLTRTVSCCSAVLLFCDKYAASVDHPSVNPMRDCTRGWLTAVAHRVTGYFTAGLW